MKDKELIEKLKKENRYLKAWNKRYINRIQRQRYQLKNLRMRLKKIINSLNHIVENPYSDSNARRYGNKNKIKTGGKK